MFRPIAEVDSEVVTIRCHSPSIITFAVDNKIIRLDTRRNSYDTIYSTPNDNSIIHGFDIDDNNTVYVHYSDGNIHRLVNGDNVIANIDDPNGRMSLCFDTVLAVNNRWLLWAVGNVTESEDIDTQDLSSDLKSQYGKLYRYTLRTSTTSEILAYGIRGINGMLYYNNKLYVAHNGYNWRSVYMLDIDRNNQYLGWRYYDGPLPTLRKIDNQGWIIVYPDTTTVPSPIKPKLTYSPTMRPVGTGYIKGVIYYNGKLRYLDSDMGIVGINLGSIGYYTAATNNEDTVYISVYTPNDRLWVIGKVDTKNHRQYTKMSHKHIDSSTEEIQKLAKIFERSKLRSGVDNIGVPKVIKTPHHHHRHHRRHRHRRQHSKR
jgi:hypothetical protein